MLGSISIANAPQLYNRQPDPNTANYNLDVLREFRHDRFQESIQKNPYYYCKCFCGSIIVRSS